MFSFLSFIKGKRVLHLLNMAQSGEAPLAGNDGGHGRAKREQEALMISSVAAQRRQVRTSLSINKLIKCFLKNNLIFNNLLMFIKLKEKSLIIFNRVNLITQ